MLKKWMITGCITAGVFVGMPCSIYAEGVLTVTDQTAHIYSGKDSGYFYAKVENIGDEPIGVDNSTLVLLSDQDEILETTEFVSTYPNRLILNPGEYTYMSEFLWNGNLKNRTIGEIKFAVDPTDRGRICEKIPCDVSYDLNGSGSFDNCIYITVGNESDEIRYGYYLITALYDKSGNLAYVDKTCYEKVGLHPESTVTIGLYVDRDNLDYFETNGITIASADAIVYYIPEE